MDISNKYSIYFGTVRCVIGNTSCEVGKSAKYDILDRTENVGVTCMEWGRNQDEIVVGQSNGLVRLYDTATSQITRDIDIDGTGAIVGAAASAEDLIIARKSGHISLWNENRCESFSLNLSNDSTLGAINYSKSRTNIIATGGERNDFKLWDMETKKCIFKSKSLGHDSLNLPIPTSIRGIAFLDSDGKLPACCTKEGYVLLYDERVQRRPINKFIEPKASYTTMASALKERQCFVGTTKGYMQLLDLKQPAKCIKTFKTFTGSVSSICCDPLASVVVTVSLDKFLRIHDVETKQLLYKEYLKQSLTKVLLKPIIKEEADIDQQEDVIKNDTAVIVDEEYEKIFDSMETVGEHIEKISKSKRRMVKNFMAEESNKKIKKRKKIKL